MAGALLALLGLAWMAVGPQDVVLPLTALVAMLGAAMAIGQSIIVGKRVSGNHPAVTNAVGMSVGTVLLLLLSVTVGETWSAPANAEAWWAVCYPVTLGSVGLFVLVLLVVRWWTASATSYMFVLFPRVTWPSRRSSSAAGDRGRRRPARSWSWSGCGSARCHRRRAAAPDRPSTRSPSRSPSQRSRPDPSGQMTSGVTPLS